MYNLKINDEYSFHRIPRKEKKKIKKMIAKECNLTLNTEISKYFISYITFGITRRLEIKKSNKYTEKLLEERIRGTRF